jgi:hypothetical protein
MKQINITELTTKIEKKYISKALKETKGNVAKASRLLGLKRTTLLMKIRSLGIIISREHESQFVNKQLLDSRMLVAYENFSLLDKQKKIDAVMPRNSLSIDLITNTNLEQRFEQLIHGEYKELLIKKLVK